jgi:hypothetical protein
MGTVYNIKITSNNGTSQVVDMTNLNPTTDFSLKNPIAIINLPTNAGNSTPYLNFNTASINLTMIDLFITCSFISKDGLGDSPFSMASVTSSSTIFQQLMYLAFVDSKPKRLYVNDNSLYLYCHIMDYNGTATAGQKDIIRHTLTLSVVGQYAQ